MRISHAIILVCLTAFVAVTPSHAQNKVGTTAAAFLGIGTDAKSLAMGNANVAFANDHSALFWNPAGISKMTKSSVTASNADWFVDSNLRTFSLVLNTGMCQLGLLVSSLDYGEIEVTTISNPEGTGERFEPNDLSVGVTFARSLTDRFAFGATGKYVRQQIWNEVATGAAIDLGVLYTTSFNNLRIGMSMSNFGTDMKLAGTDLRESIDIDPDREGNNPNLAASLEVDDWPLPLNFRVGVAIDPLSSATQRFTIAVDALHPSDNSESANIGGEYAFREIFFLRGGYRQAFADIADDGGWTAGAGLKYEIGSGIGTAFDYAFMNYNDLGTQQMWSLTISF